MTTSLSSVLTGSQEPRVRSVPAYEYSSGAAAAKIYESTGRSLDLWQKDALEDHCAEKANGRWLTLESAEEVPRQNGKGEIINGLMLLHLFVLRTRTIIYSAHEFKTAKESYLKVYELVRNTPHLHKQVEYYHNSNEDTSIKLKTGERLRFLTRSKDGGRGFTGDAIIFDEAFNLSQASLAAVLPTLSSRPNPHIYYFSSSGKDTGESDVFRKIKKRGDSSDPKIIWRSFSADPKTVDPDSVESRAQANPAYNVRIFDDFIDVERENMTEIDFLRERMGIWDDAKTAAVVDLDVWDALGDPMSSPLDPVAFAIDVNPDSSFSSIAVAGKTAGGRVFTQVVKRERGTGWVIDEVQSLVAKWKPTSVTLDAIGPAGSLVPGFTERGISIDVVSMVQYGQACGSFKALVEDRRLVHNNQSGLRAALESARKRPLGESGLWGWHRRDTTDITPLVAVTLATYAHSRTAAPEQPVDSRMFVFR